MGGALNPRHPLEKQTLALEDGTARDSRVETTAVEDFERANSITYRNPMVSLRSIELTNGRIDRMDTAHAPENESDGSDGSEGSGNGSFRIRSDTKLHIPKMFDSRHDIIVDKMHVHSRGDAIGSLRVGDLLNPIHPLLTSLGRALEITGCCHAIVTAFDMSFGTMRERPLLMAFDLIVDMLYVIEMVAQWHTAMYVPAGDVFVTDKKVTRKHFLRKKLPLRVIHTLPLQFVHWASVPKYVGYQKGKPLARLRAFKLLRLKPLFVDNEYVAASAMLGGSILQRVMGIMLRFVVVTHVIACVVHGMTFLDNGTSGLKWFDHMCSQWNLEPSCNEGQDTLWLYLVSMYYSMTVVTTVGFGNVMPYSTYQVVAHTLAAAFGACHNALLISSIMDTYNEYRRDHRSFRNAAYEIESFVNLKGVQPEVVREIRSHFNYQWARTKCLDEKRFMDKYLSSAMRTRVMEELYLDPLKETGLFKGVSDKTLTVLAEECSPIHLRQGETLCTEGRNAHTVFVVCCGRLNSVSASRNEMKTLRRGDFVGSHIDVRLNRATRSQTVVAETYSDLLVIDSDKFQEFTSSYAVSPSFIERAN